MPTPQLFTKADITEISPWAAEHYMRPYTLMQQAKRYVEIVERCKVKNWPNEGWLLTRDPNQILHEGVRSRDRILPHQRLGVATLGMPGVIHAQLTAEGKASYSIVKQLAGWGPLAQAFVDFVDTHIQPKVDEEKEQAYKQGVKDEKVRIQKALAPFLPPEVSQKEQKTSKQPEDTFRPPASPFKGRRKGHPFRGQEKMTEEVKNSLWEEHISGVSIGDLARKHDVVYNTIAYHLKAIRKKKNLA